MRWMLRPSVLVGVGCAVALAALIVVGFLTDAYAEILVGVLATAVLAVSVLNRQLLRATYWETHTQGKKQREVMKNLRVLRNRQVELQQSVARLSGAQAKLSDDVARIAQRVDEDVDEARIAETAARFDWLARRYRVQEKQLAEFLEQMSMTMDLGHDAFGKQAAGDVVPIDNGRRADRSDVE